MCGFVGWVNLDLEKPVDPLILKAMNNTLRHRGPDDEGYFISDNVGIAHSRLSIIDISANGRQPIFNEDQSVLVVLNGEIYNYRTLKEELIKEGHSFFSETDTEVLVHAYEKWGVRFLNELDGMFSLALYDIRNNKLIIAKDPFGKKPLYYTFQNNVFLFASELTAFTPNPRFNQALDYSSLFKYLAYDYVPTPHCIFKDCQKLPAASYMVVNTNNLPDTKKPEKYWQLQYEPKLAITVEEAREELFRLLMLAVKKRLISDVPLGVFLSGGLDSSTIVALMAELQKSGSIKTFNIGFTEKSFDESTYAKQIAHYFDTNHFEKIFNPEKMFEVFPKIVENLGEPFADASILPTYLLCEFAKKHVTVALGGDGGDELFAGYDTFLADRFSFLMDSLPSNLIKWLRLLAGNLPISDKNMDMGFKINHFLKGYLPFSKKCPELRNNIWLGSFSSDTMRSLFNDDITPDPQPMIYETTRCYMQETQPTNNVDKLISNFTQLYLHDDILVKVDRASMMNSLEVRAPFLDKNLAEFVNRLPVNMKMRGVKRKLLLKETAKPLLPKTAIDRKKKGFGVPIAKWFRGPLKEFIQDTLRSEKTNEIFKANQIERLLNDHLSNKKDHRKEIWSLLVFELWRKYHGC